MENREAKTAKTARVASPRPPYREGVDIVAHPLIKIVKSSRTEQSDAEVFYVYTVHLA